MELEFALFGAGRIGRLHAANLLAHPAARLAAVYDVDRAGAENLAARCGARVAETPADAIRTGGAVLIASSTDTHVELLTAAVQAGRPVFCEKPIDLDLARVDACWEAISGLEPIVQIGFNRRYDPTHRALREAVADGAAGAVEQIHIVSRDPEPPPIEYLRRSGGLFRDMMIHDFDLARFLLPEEPVDVTAAASCLIDAAIGDAGDVDTAMVTLRTKGGILCHISNSRRSVYGYDQRIEVFGSAGLLRSDNPTPTALRRWDASATEAASTLHAFFTGRYAESYRAELDAFIDAVVGRRTPDVTFEDGRRALVLAEAAEEAWRTGRTVSL